MPLLYKMKYLQVNKSTKPGLSKDFFTHHLCLPAVWSPSPEVMWCLSLYTCLQELANLRQGSSGEVDELKAQLASTKEVLEADIKNKEEVQCVDHFTVM